MNYIRAFYREVLKSIWSVSLSKIWLNDKASECFFNPFFIRPESFQHTYMASFFLRCLNSFMHFFFPLLICHIYFSKLYAARGIHFSKLIFHVLWMLLFIFFFFIRLIGKAQMSGYFHILPEHSAFRSEQSTIFYLIYDINL